MDASEEEEAIQRTRKSKVKEFVNEAALKLKLETLTGGADDDSDRAWLETLSVTAEESLDIEDAEDDLKRELAL